MMNPMAPIMEYGHTSFFNYTSQPSDLPKLSKLFAHEFDIRGELFECYLDGYKQIIKHGTCIYHSFANLLEKMGDFLIQEDRLKELALLANFFFQKDKYEVLLNPDEYRQAYLNRIRDPKPIVFHPHRRRCSLPCNLDISEITDPYIKDKQFIFFVKGMCDSMPYKVSCPIPFEDGCSAHYELLPNK